MLITRENSASKFCRRHMLNFIFDLDDTLLATWDAFNTAENDLFDELAKLGFDRELAKKTFIEIDNKNVDIWGFLPKRFYTSMGETYSFLCNLKGVPYEERIREIVEEIGKSVFRTPPPLLDGAIDLLNTLIKNGSRLYLWTKGDHAVQLQKIKFHSLNRYFIHVYILEQKNKIILGNIVQENSLDIKYTWVVGDSIRSEINPALELNLNAIWFSGKSWRYEEIEPISGRFKTVTQLSEIKAVYPELVKISQHS